MLETSRGTGRTAHPVTVRLAYMLARMTSETVLLLGHFAPQFIAIYWIIGYAPSLQAFVTTVVILLANGVTAQVNLRRWNISRSRLEEIRSEDSNVREE